MALGVSIFSLMTVAYAGEHAHFAAFFDTGKNKNFVFPAIVEGDHIESDMVALGADMMLFAHSAGIQNGDVWSVQNDSLREVDGVYQDFGLNCQLSLNVSPFKVGGLCSVFMSGHEGEAQEKVKHLIKSQVLKDEVVWYKVFEDKEHGVSGYFMRETAVDFNH